MVLEALCRLSVEYIEDIYDPHLTLKTTFLLEISSLNRVGDLQFLSVAPTHLDFAPSMAKAFLFLRTGYVPKVPSSAPQPIVLQACCAHTFWELDQQSTIVYVQCEHWVHTCTEMPSGEMRTNCSSATVPLGDICRYKALLTIFSPLSSPRRWESELSQFGVWRTPSLSHRCPNTGHLQFYW